MDRLHELLEDGIIDEVYSQLKTGKEAEVWLVSHRGEPVAAKIYKLREFRSFKNDAGYKEGRQVRNTRTQRAMNKGSKFGRESAEEAWKSAEADAMATLHASGVKVPRPVLFYEGVLLMEVIGDAEGRVAPRLIDAGIAPEQASALYFQIRTEIIKMLSLDLIHGDLSEFNILLGVNGPIIIDFPQIVTAAKNSRSEHFFRRDLGNIVRFFSNLDPTLAKHVADADEIWRAYVRRDLSPHFVPTGRVPQPARNRGPARFNSGNQNSGRPPQSGPANSNASPHQGTPHRHPRGQTPPVEAGISGGAKRPNAAPSRRGPEVAVKGQGLRPRGAPQAGPEQRKSGGGANRRRPPRRF